MKIKSILIASLAVTVVCGAAIAADSGNTQQTDATSTTDLAQQIQNPLAGDNDGWNFKLMPYAWLPTTLKSKSTLSGLEGNVRLNLQDILDNLDMLMFARVEAWKDDRWGLSYDTDYLNLGYQGGFELNRSAKIQIGGPRFNRDIDINAALDVGLDVDVRLWMNDFAVHYRLVDERFGDGNQQRFIFEPYGGLRYTYLRQEADINADLDVSIRGSRFARQISRSEELEIGDSRDWVEPFVGGRISWDLNDKFSLNFRGDVGGFGIGSGSNLTYNLIPGCSYRLTKNTTLDLSYRYFNMDYSNGHGSNKLAMDAEAYGPVFGMTILF